MGKGAREVVLEALSEGLHADSWANCLQSIPDPRDRALALELLSGVTRWRNLLDEYISGFSDRPVEAISNRLKHALRIGAFQLLFLDMPPYTVDSVVSLLSRKGQRGYCNAVLREMARSLGHIEFPDIDQDPIGYMASRWSCPEWIVLVLLKRFGLEDALKLLERSNRRPVLSLRANLMRSSGPELLERMVSRGYDATGGRLAASVRVQQGGAVEDMPGYDEGLFTVQDEGAMLVSLVLDPRPGQTIWDACAAPGGKATHIAEIMEGTGTVFATDLDPFRAGMITESKERLGLRNIHVRVLDATAGWPDPEMFDGVLVDAPCSGLGVLDRNPDLRWNRRPSDIPKLARLQKRMLEAVAPSVKGGGTLVYSTCTLTQEENEGVWEDFLRDHREFAPCDLEQYVMTAGLEFSKGHFAGPGYCHLLPHVTGTGGFFIGRAVRTRECG